MVKPGDTLVGRYRIDARIGSGGFATVFRAHDLRLERDVAVKVLLPDQAADADVVARFDREARALATFSHPNVVAIHDVEPATPSVGGMSFLVMDLCEGGSLSERLAASGSHGLTPEILVPILLDAARGLAALHEAGVIHRDVKPSNVLLTGGRALIADLGIAVATTLDPSGFRDAIGTLPYVAPEQLAGAPATFASDVHALGVVAYLGFTGRLPRAAGSFGELLEASARPVPTISSLAPELGTPFDRPVAAALANDPAARPTVDRFAARLERGLDRWREIGASRMTGLAVAPAAVAAAAAMPSDAAGVHDPPDPMAPPPGPDDATVVDPSMAATTRLAGRPTPPSPASPAEVADQRRRDAADRGAEPGWRRAIGVLIIGLAVITGVVLLLAAFAPARDGDEGSTSATASAARPTASTSTPSPTPTSTATASPLSSAAPTEAAPFAAAAEASREMHAAIAAARGHSGLNGREAKELDRPLDQFDRAVQKQDGETARRAAAAVAEAVQELVQRHEVSQQAGARLQSAAADLRAAAEELPG